MLHPIVKPTATEMPRLGRVMALADLVLAFALNQDPAGYASPPASVPDELPTQKTFLDFQKALGMPFWQEVQSRFEAHFVEPADLPAARWLLARRSTLMSCVALLVALPLAEKQGWYPVLRHDLDLERCVARGDFAKPPTGCDKAHAIIEALMGYFYSAVLGYGNGIPADVMRGSHVFTRQDLLKAYEANNPDLDVCPGCDAQGVRQDETGHIHADNDHFFPKSKYPLLAVHPLNLTPLCGDCNRYHKRDRDVLQPAGVRNLADIFHPYERPALPEIDVSITSNASGEPQVSLCPKDKTSRNRARVKSLKYLLRLPERWQGNLKSGLYHRTLYKALLNRAGEYVEGTSPRPGSIPASLLDGWLRREQIGALDGIGTLPDRVALTAYIAWVRGDTKALGALQAKLDTYVLHYPSQTRAL